MSISIFVFIVFLSLNGKLQLLLRVADKLYWVDDVLAVDITDDTVFIYQLIDEQAALLGIDSHAVFSLSFSG